MPASSFPVMEHVNIFNPFSVFKFCLSFLTVVSIFCSPLGVLEECLSPVLILEEQRSCLVKSNQLCVEGSLNKVEQVTETRGLKETRHGKKRE